MFLVIGWFHFPTGYILLAVLIAVTRLDRARGTFSFFIPLRE
jgi:hypothetical protein